jgi:hypothetical protein
MRKGEGGRGKGEERGGMAIAVFIPLQGLEGGILRIRCDESQSTRSTSVFKKGSFFWEEKRAQYRSRPNHRKESEL